MASRNAAGMSPLFSIVRYERHRVESSTPGSTRAPVGHASRQRVHLPQQPGEVGGPGGSHGVGQPAPVRERVALDEGSLTGTITPETTFPEGDWRHTYFGGNRKAELQPRLRAIETDLGISTAQLPETALRFVLSNPAVSTVIVGMRSVRNVERNLALADGRGLPAEQAHKLYAHRWDRNWYLPTGD